MSQAHTLTPILNWVLGGNRHPFLGACVLEPSFACMFICTCIVSRLYQYIKKVNIGAHHMIFKKAVLPWEATEYIFTQQWLIFLTFSFSYCLIQESLTKSALPRPKCSRDSSQSLMQTELVILLRNSKKLLFVGSCFTQWWPWLRQPKWKGPQRMKSMPLW